MQIDLDQWHGSYIDNFWSTYTISPNSWLVCTAVTPQWPHSPYWKKRSAIWLLGTGNQPLSPKDGDDKYPCVGRILISTIWNLGCTFLRTPFAHSILFFMILYLKWLGLCLIYFHDIKAQPRNHGRGNKVNLAVLVVYPWFLRITMS